jgi:ABC-2 type transport system ATP-binding protein
MGRRMVRDIILDLRRRGRTVFFSTHILSDAEALCDRVALLRAGRLLQVGPLQEILRIDVANMEVLVSGVDEARLSGAPGISSRQQVGERWRLEVEEHALGSLVCAVEAQGGRILSVSPVRQSLEEYFFKEMTAEEQQAWTLEH